MFLLLKKLKTRLFKSNDSKLLDQAFMTFDATFLKLKTNHKETKELSHIIESIETLLTGEKNWQNANRIEQLMIPLLNDAEVSNELEKKLSLVKKYSDKNIYENYAEKAKTGNENEKEIWIKLTSHY